VATLAEATAGLAWSGYDRVSQELKADGEAHNARVANVKADLHKSFKGFDEALARIGSDCEPATYGELFATVETCKIDRTSMMTELASLWNNRTELAKRSHAELLGMVPGAEAKLEETVTRVLGELEKIGSGVAAQAAARVPGHEATAEHQLRWQARYANVHSQAAAAELGDIRAAVEGASDQVGFSEKGKALAAKFIKTVARKMLAAV
jgi:hypothetical protein